jgi:hypothetical protein
LAILGGLSATRVPGDLGCRRSVVGCRRFELSETGVVKFRVVICSIVKFYLCFFSKKKKKKKMTDGWTWHMPSHLCDYCSITKVVDLSLLLEDMEDGTNLVVA